MPADRTRNCRLKNYVLHHAWPISLSFVCRLSLSSERSDDAAAEACPLWPAQPMTAHWGVPDPAEAKGNPAEIALAFKDAYRMLNQRIGIFTALPLRSLDKLSLQTKLNEIGHA